MDTRPLMGPMGQAYLKSDEYGKKVLNLCPNCMEITCKLSSAPAELSLEQTGTALKHLIPIQIIHGSCMIGVVYLKS